MELINATRMLAGYTMGLEPSGRELLVVAIKGTFRLPASNAPVQLHEEQVPLVMADVFTGEPGLSAPLYEVDYAPRKAMCDVLLNGSAYAPSGKRANRVQVGLRVGTLVKQFNVVGDRVWEVARGRTRATPAQAFESMRISYDVAFGGTDTSQDDPAKHDAYLPNPVGRGFARHPNDVFFDGKPLPNTEEPSQPVDRPDGAYRPMSLGPVGRNWEPRFRYAGTYDQAWLDDVFPFLPADFDERYHQCAPADQQLATPIGSPEVVLLNLTPDGMRRFTLPNFEAPVHVFPKRGPREDLKATLDTLVIEPDLERLTLTWRVARPLAKNMHEIAQVLVGRKGREWWQQREEVAFPIPVVMVPAGSEPAPA
jgi:hypothetical protein